MKYFFVRPQFTVSINESTAQTSASASNDIFLDIAFSDGDICVYSVPLTASDGKCKMCYICKTAAIAGKFDVEKARALNIPAGPNYGLLKSGKSIRLTDGVIIEPCQVLGEAQKSRYFAIICAIENEFDSADLGLISSLLNSEYFYR